MTMAQEQGVFVVTVSDDGRGFEPGQTTEQGVGFKLMRYRADILRGRLDVHSSPNASIRVRVSIPIATHA